MIRPIKMPGFAMVPASQALGPGRFGSRFASLLLAGLTSTVGAGAQVAGSGVGEQPIPAGAAAPLPVGGASGRSVIPVRWTSGPGVWSLQPEAIRGFVETGLVSDRSLASAIDRSGWSPEELRLGLAKPYSVDLVALARFLYSSDGLAFLRTQTSGYGPSSTQSTSTKSTSAKSTYAVEALRSAIIAAAAGGQISALAIMAHLPTDFSTGKGCGRLGVCAPSKCVGEAQCTSLMSWYVFLPACLQANQARQAAPAGVSPLGRPLKP